VSTAFDDSLEVAVNPGLLLDQGWATDAALDRVPDEEQDEEQEEVLAEAQAEAVRADIAFYRIFDHSIRRR